MRGVSKSVIIGSGTFVVHFCTWSFCLSVGIFYTAFLEEFKQGNGLTSWIQALCFFTLCAVGPIASMSISACGCRGTIFVGTLVASGGLLATAFATNILFVILSFGLVTGVGYGLCYTAAMVIVAENVRTYRVLILALSMCGFGAAGFVFPVLCTYLMNTYGWRGAFIILSGITLHALIAALLLREKDRTQTIEADNTPWSFWAITAKVLKNPDYWILCVNEFTFTLGMNVFYTYVAAFALHVGLTPYKGAMILSGSAVANIIGRITLGLLSSWQNSKVDILYMCSYLMCGVSTIAYTLWHHFYWLLICAVIFGFFMPAYGTLTSEVTHRVSGTEHFNVAYGYLLVPMALGTLAGPPIAGVLLDVTGIYPASFYFGGACTVVGALPLILVSIRLRRTYPRIHREKILLETYV